MKQKVAGKEAEKGRLGPGHGAALWAAVRIRWP